jgi:uncharacterized membrane protein
MSIESLGAGSQGVPEAGPYAAQLSPERSAVTRAVETIGRVESFALQRRIAAGLGCFSIGLGLFELIAPHALARLIGLGAERMRWRSRLEQLSASAGRWARRAEANRWARAAGVDRPVRQLRARLPGDFGATSATAALLIRGLGVREIVSGIGILTRPRPASWLWSRVAGDALNLSLLGFALASRRANRARLLGTSAAVLAVAALDVFASVEFTRMRRAGRPFETRRRRVPLEAAMLIDRSPEECYRFWRDLTNLPRFMRSVEAVRIETDSRSHWVAKGPGGIELEWDSEIVHDTLNRVIAWRSVNAEVPHAGSVHFDPAPGGRGTLVRVSMNHGGDPGGALSRLAARLMGKVPEIQIREDLGRFKRILETGEIPTTRGQPSGRRSLIARTFGRGAER